MILILCKEFRVQFFQNISLDAHIISLRFLVHFANFLDFQIENLQVRKIKNLNSSHFV